MRDIITRLIEQSVEFSLQFRKPNNKELRVAINTKVRWTEDLPLRNQVGQELTQTSRELIRAQASLVEPLQIRPG